MIENFLLTLIPQLLHVADLIGQWFDAHFVNILVIIFGAWIVRRFGAKFFSRLLHFTIRTDLYPNKFDREKREKTLSTLAGAFMRVGVYIAATILIVGEINPSYTTALFASAGLLGVALGFGAKDLINDFMSGIFIITENQYRVGDVIKVGGVSGVVEDITIRTTVLRDLGSNVHHVPNGTIKLTSNLTLGFSGIDETIELGYDSDPAKLKKIINDIGQELSADEDYGPKIIEPLHFLRLDGFGPNGLLVKVVGKTAAGSQWEIKGVFYERLLIALKKHGIEIPYPHVTLDGSVNSK